MQTVSQEDDDIFDDGSSEEEIKKIRGTIEQGDCLYCGAKNGMKHDGHVCFICTKCGMSVYEDIYYRWAAGYSVEFEE